MSSSKKAYFLILEGILATIDLNIPFLCKNDTFCSNNLWGLAINLKPFLTGLKPLVSWGIEPIRDNDQK